MLETCKYNCLSAIGETYSLAVWESCEVTVRESMLFRRVATSPAPFDGSFLGGTSLFPMAIFDNDRTYNGLLENYME